MPGARVPVEWFLVGVESFTIGGYRWDYWDNNLTQDTEILLEDLYPHYRYVVVVRYCLTRHLDTCGDFVYTGFRTLQDGESFEIRLVSRVQ